jgi:hypothetical protein
MSSEKFHYRSFTSYLLTWCFLVLLVSGVILFLAPPGRIANWTDWTLGGLTKNQWTGIHTLTAVVFLIAGLFHLLKFNWKLFWNYLSVRLSKNSRVPRELILSLLFMGILLGGTLAGWQPFSGVLNWGESAKNSWETPKDAPPIPHMELLSIREVANRLSLPEERAVEILQQSGLSVSGSDQKWKDLAAAAGKSPADLYLFLLSKSNQSSQSTAIPQQTSVAGHPVGSGLGQKTIAEAAQEIGIPIDKAIAKLKNQGIDTDPQENVRALADRIGKRPFEIVDILKR